jgi:hypothetical protein
MRGWPGIQPPAREATGGPEGTLLLDGILRPIRCLCENSLRGPTDVDHCIPWG